VRGFVVAFLKGNGGGPVEAGRIFPLRKKLQLFLIKEVLP
jgi:hypothetical protein